MIASVSLSGVWWGNSQIFALVAWIGQALAQSSWGRDCCHEGRSGMLLKDKALLAKGFSQVRYQVWFGAERLGFWKDMPLDYYVYSSFTENPSNQCLVHAKAACSACLAACDNSGYAGSARVFADVSRPGPDTGTIFRLPAERLWEQPALLLHGAGTMDPVGRALRWEGAAVRIGVVARERARPAFQSSVSCLLV